jgi:hypothetical protein
MATAHPDEALAGRVVQAVYACRFLTPHQVYRLFGRQGDEAERLAGRLVSAGYLAAIHRPTINLTAPTTVFALAQRGANLIADRVGVDRRRVKWRKYHNVISLPYLEHRLAVNDVRIALTAGLRSVGGEVDRWWYEFKIEENIDDPDELMPPLKLRPDAYARVRAHVRHVHLFVEVDLATEAHSRIRSKVRRFLAYRDSRLFRVRLGGRAFRVLIVVPGPTRLRALKRVVEDEGGRRMFWLACRPDVTERDINARVWHLAGESQPARLFETVQQPLQAVQTGR